MRVRWLKITAGVAVALLALAAAALFAFRTPGTDPAAMRAKYGGPPSQFVDLGGGLTVHLRDTGPRGAPVLILLHGSNASLHTWEPWAARLGTRYRVIRYDQIGHGLTGPNPDGDYSVDAFVRMLDRVRARLGIDRFVLAGNSMGGGIALRYAMAHPGRVRGLILVDAAGAPPPADYTPPLAFRIARTPGLRDLAAMVTPRSLLRDTLSAAFTDQSFVNDRSVDLYWELLRYPGNRAATIARFATPDARTPVAAFAALSMPVLILWGADDRLIPLASGQWLAAHIPNSQLIVYPHTGHAPMEEAADKSALDVYRLIETRVKPPLRP